MPDETKAEAFLTVNRGPNLPPLRLQSIDDLKSQLERDKQAWSWINGFADRNDMSGTVANKLRSLTKALTERLTKYEASSKTDRAQAQTDVEHSAKEFYAVDGNGFDSTTPASQFIFRIREYAGDHVAAVAASFLFGQRDVRDPQITGAVLACFYLISPFIEAHKKSADLLISQWSEKLTTTKTEVASEIASGTAARSKVETDLKKLYDDRNAQYDDLVKRYKEIQEFKEPANYWEHRKNAHRGGFYFASFLTLSTAGGCGFALYLLANKVKADIISTNAGDLWHIIPHSFPLLLATGGLFWLLRVMVRIVLSNYHIATDAGERVVLAKTFLALQASGAEFTKDDKLIVLGQLFRHASTDVAKDDASPPLAIKNFITEK